MGMILDSIVEWLKEVLVGGIVSNLSGMFDSVNQQVGDIAGQVGATPQAWNGSIYNMIRSLSDNVIIPIAGVILAFVMTMELIQMVADKNNMHGDVDTWMFFKWIFKTACAVIIVTNTWNIVMGVFDVGTKIIANHLNDNNVPTRHGDLWTYCTISNIITNPVYMGKIRRGWSQQIKTIENGEVKKKIKRKKNIEDYNVFEGLHEALITEEQFMLAQQIRLEKQPAPKVKDEFELQNAFVGLLYCSTCGKRIGRTTSSKSRDSRARFRCVNSRNCHNVSSDYDVVEKEIISALREWLKGYRIKIDTVGYAKDIEALRNQNKKHTTELQKLNAQLENAYNLVEQGAYTLEIFKSRQEKLNASVAEVKAKISENEITIARMEQSDNAKANLIPQTETLLASYDEMTNEERNALLKEILKKIEYKKEANGQIEIDLYPRLPKI